ncbi:hypothetical protein LJR066_005723 [Acidovorax sp. LjRoot66]|uniref:hypothetical protein n=1 Tax=Acidovorax sp. LjRoot66 TaxID=3342334 RepID=UPI003ED12523
MKTLYDDEFDAIATAIGNSGKPFKLVAAHMFPDMKAESAYARLKDCCNPTGTQRLSFGQVLRLMQFCGCYDALYYACDETLHARPDRKAPEDHVVRLAEIIDTATATMNAALKALAQVQQSQGKGDGTLRAVA